MRPLLAVIIYLTALSGAGVSAGYVSLVLEERGFGGSEDGSGELELKAEAEPVAEGETVPSSRAHFARQAALFTWGMAGGSVLFVVLHLLGFYWLRGGLVGARVEVDAEDLLSGLAIHCVAAILAAVFGGFAGHALA